MTQSESPVVFPPDMLPPSDPGIGPPEEDDSEWIEYRSPVPEQPSLFLNPHTKEVRIGSIHGELDEESTGPGSQADHENRSRFVLNAVYNVQNDMHGLLGKAQHLSPTICDDAREILSVAGRIERELRFGGEKAVDERNDVEFLVDFKRLKWDFDNPTVHKFRISAQAADHSAYQFQDWHMPQYVAEGMPIREDVDGSGRHGANHNNGYVIRVLLPIQDADGNQSDTTLRFSATDSAKKVIAEAHAKAKVAMSFVAGNADLGVSDDYVFKAHGAADFMDGDTPLLNFEYLRQQLRENKPVVLCLVPRPEPIIVENEDRYALIYKDHVKRSRTLLGEHRRQLQENLKCSNSQIMDLIPDVLNGHMLQNIESLPAIWSDLRSIPSHELHLPFRFEFVGLDGCSIVALPFLPTETQPHIFLQCFTFYGMTRLRSTSWSSTPKPWSSELSWRQQMFGPARDTLISQLPREARLGLILYAQSSPADKPVRLGWAVRPLHDESGLFLQGDQIFNLWPFTPKTGKHAKKRNTDPDFIYRATTRDNHMPGPCCRVYLRFPTYEFPVLSPLTLKYRSPDISVVGRPQPLSSLEPEELRQLDMLITCDPLYKSTESDRRSIWRMRHHLVKHPQILPRFLQCVDWGCVEQKLEAHRLLNDWSPPESIVTVLELLDLKFPDYHVREYAVQCLQRIDDDQLKPYLLQLTQCLKFEPYHDNPLTRFLLARALANPFVIGHFTFWHLKAELHRPQFAERFGLILEEYLSHSGRHAIELRKQSMMCNKFTEVADKVVQMRRNHFSAEDTRAKYITNLERLNRDFFAPMKKFKVPFDPKLEATTLIVDKCRYMESKMAPLWLVFNNADPQGKPIMFIFKSGDDLRQDILTLQLLTIMDRIWLATGIDMRMKPYKVMATGVNENGDGVGLIEVVSQADTTSGIQKKYGGGMIGALRIAPLANYIREHNPTPEQYELAVDNFARSCAGYTVATFVLGIGDRHNGNIMISKEGHLFHIDFGHFLGNFKSKMGWNRERAAFVFTPEMAYVMGGKDYQKSKPFLQFLQMCFQGYQVLRQNAHILENLFILMIAAGMPELMSESDIFYMRNMLRLDQSRKAAERVFYDEIKTSLATTYRRVDNMIHIWKNNG